MEPTASNTFNGLFDGKTRPQIERSIRAHRGAQTKVFRYIDTACNAATVLPTSKGAREIENLRLRMEEKIEEIEAGYDTLIEIQPDDERKYLEKKAGISDEAIQMHARILPALAKCPSEITVNRTHHGGNGTDPQTKIRESLKPDKLKLNFTPMEFRKWTAQIKTFFAASNLQYAPYQEQIGYVHMCLDANLSNHVSVTAQGDTPIMTYEDELGEEITCLDIIEAEFIKRYPITTRRHDLIQQRQQKGQPLTAYINTMLALGRDAAIAQLSPEGWLANIIIAGTIDDEAKKELMKIDNPDMEKVRKAANTHEKEQNCLKPAAITYRAFQIKSNNTGKPITCYACGEVGHKSVDCKKNKESLKCTKCKRTGHLAKICRSKADSGNTQRRSDRARVATTEKAEEDEDNSAIHEARTLRSDAGTPKLLL